MHPSALFHGKTFFETYCPQAARALGTPPGTPLRVAEIGSQNINGSLRDVCPTGTQYTGLDFAAGNGVDIVLDDPYTLPLGDASADIVVSSSCFEHSDFFWLVFLEVLRILKPGGVFYLNVPSNSLAYHHHPADNWRFSPDAGHALAAWGQRNGVDAVLLESFVGARCETGWHDFVGVFLKDASYVDHYPQRMMTRGTAYFNGFTRGAEGIANLEPLNSKDKLLAENRRQIAALNEELDRYKKQLGAALLAPSAPSAAAQASRDASTHDEPVRDASWQRREYCDVYARHRGYVAYKVTHYPFLYDRIFASHLDAGKPLTLLEIGVQNGGSLQIWKDYLPPGSEIHGIDINPACQALEFGDGIQFHLGSATDLDFINTVFKDVRFDVILDDGSHMQADIAAAFLNLFKKLQPGGVYVVEDLLTAYWKQYGGGFGKHDSAIEFFKRFVDGLNGDHLTEIAPQRGPEAIPFLSMYREEIASVAFYDSICAITRYRAPKRAPFVNMTTGTECNVARIGAEYRIENRLLEFASARAACVGSAERPDTASERENLLSRGIEAYRHDCFEQATAVFSDLLRRFPQDPLPPAWLAILCARQGLTDGAHQFMTCVQALAPERAELQAAIGEGFLKANLPVPAAQYLREALARQPDLWSAYPALAQSLFLSGEGEEAIALLEGAANATTPAGEAIRYTLIDLLAQRGDLDGLTQALERFSTRLESDLLMAHGLALLDSRGERFVAALGKVQDRLAAAFPACSGTGGDAPRYPDKYAAPVRIAFIVSDVTRETWRGQLAPLLSHLPGNEFVPMLVLNDPHSSLPIGGPQATDIDYLLVEHILPVVGQDEQSVLALLHEHAPDILIDLDAYGPRQMLTVFAQARVPCKLLWSATPMPSVLPGCATLAGEALGVGTDFPTVPLPGLGEVAHFPDLPVAASARRSHACPVFACLTPIGRVGAQSWHTFAEVLNASPDALLLLNTGTLPAAAPARIRTLFERADVAPERLRFVSASNREELCRLWWRADIGLAPAIDDGGPALPAALWMGRPCIALDSALPWSRRPSALLRALDKPEWIAANTAHYVELARQLAAQGAPAPDPLLRERMKSRGLADPAAFARGFADALRALARQAPRCAVGELA
ncbi:MAG: methyltransferase domain-containing protein [Azoarcus sp.]|jgi:SAM-dependent methyltransferase|nr:methyltransferase domain-containing protein [Azoarcus sp.]